MVRPPRLGEASYPLWKKETDAIHAALAERTATMAGRLNALPGVSVVTSPGALYLYPRIRLSDAAIAAAEAAGKEPDAFLRACAACGHGYLCRARERLWPARGRVALPLDVSLPRGG